MSRLGTPQKIVFMIFNEFGIKLAQCLVCVATLNHNSEERMHICRWHLKALLTSCTITTDDKERLV